MPPPRWSATPCLLSIAVAPLTDRLHVRLVLSAVAARVVVLVARLVDENHVAAVHAGEISRGRDSASGHQVVDPRPGLPAITSTRSDRRRTWSAGQWIDRWAPMPTARAPRVP